MNGGAPRRGIALLTAFFLLGTQVAAQELVVATGIDVSLGGPGPLIVIGDLAQNLPDAAPFYIAPALPVINPHGLTLLSRDVAVASRVNMHLVDIIDIPSGTVTGSFNPGGSGDSRYDGDGSIGIDPTGAYVLMASGSETPANRATLFVVPTPLSSTSVASSVITLPGIFGTAQTHGIVFDPDGGRAYVGHAAGITAIDPPYTPADVAFTIPLPPLSGASLYSYAVELTPEKSTLLATSGQTNTVEIVHAPFSASSPHDELAIDGASELDGIAALPDGSGGALVVDTNGMDALGRRAYAVSAPFSAVSMTQLLQVPAGLSTTGFEDLAISPDGQYAALVGGARPCSIP